MNNAWQVAGNMYSPTEQTGVINKLPVAVYTIVQDPMGGLHLQHQHDKFEFPYKIYGVEVGFIDYVVKSWNNTTGNLGILLNGIKGTGKTVTAQLIANQLNLPVVLVNSDYAGLLSFMNVIQQDCVFMFDEYEKIFKEERGNNSKLLTVMDGVLKNGFRKFFLLTTNNPRLDENMKQRPSRIRYIKQYGNLSPEVVKEVVDDKLIHKHLREETIRFICQLELITMDIVSAVVQEVNVHNIDPEVFAPIFNVTKLVTKYDVYRIGQDLEGNIVRKSVGFNQLMQHIPQMRVGEPMYTDREYIGVVVSFELMEDNYKIVTRMQEEPDEDEEQEEEMKKAVQLVETRTYMIEKVPNYASGYGYLVA